MNPIDWYNRPAEQIQAIDGGRMTLLKRRSVQRAYRYFRFVMICATSLATTACAASNVDGPAGTMHAAQIPPAPVLLKDRFSIRRPNVKECDSSQRKLNVDREQDVLNRC